MLILKQQVQELDCGLCVIQLMYKYYYGDWVSISTIKSKTTFNSKGINLKQLIDLGQEFGLKIKSFKGDYDYFKKIELKKPIISVIKNENVFHYIVIEKITKSYVVFIDPILGKIKETLNEFESKYLGIVLTVNKEPKHKKINSSITNDLLKINNKKEMTITSIISIFLVVLSFIGSFYLKTILDKVLPNHEFTELLYVTLGFIIIIIVKLIFNWFNNILSNNIQNKNLIEFLNLYIYKLKIVDFNKILHFNTSMHLKNLEFINSIVIFKTKYVSTIITQTFCLIFSTTILLWLNVHVFLLAVISTFISLFITLIHRKTFKKIDKEKIKINLKTQENFLSIIFGIEYFKQEETDKMLLTNWNKNINENYNLNFKHHAIETTYGFVQSLIQSIIPFIIVILSIQKIWLNELTIGQMMIFMSIFSFFHLHLKYFVQCC